MDNVTHTLIGIAAAEPLAQRRPSHRATLWVTSAVANNLPDLDVLYTWGGDRLVYMVHHRGYTHTLLLAPAQSLLWLLLLRFWWRGRADVPWRSVAALCFLGPLLHLFADAWNSYGVHPFWPFDNRWYYGDLVFIVEPWLWVIFLPVIWKRASSAVGKGLCLLLLAFMLVLSWTHALMAWPAAAALSVFSFAWIAAQRFVPSDRVRIAGAFAAVVALFGIFSWAELELKRTFAAEGSEIAALPAPGNPFCWTILAAGVDDNSYHATAYTAAPFPLLVSASACRPMLRSSMAILRPVPVAATPARVPLGEFRAPLASTCRGRAYLRFARVPYWAAGRIGDLRFDGGFTLSSSSGDACLRLEPPWYGRFLPSP